MIYVWKVIILILQCPPETYCCSITVISSTVTLFYCSADEGCEDENFVFTDLSTYDPNNVTK